MKSVLIFILVLVILVGGYIGTSVGLRSLRAGYAEGQGVSFVSSLYAEYSVVGQNCQGRDTDGDGYVSCDFRLMNPEKTERVVHLQCPTFSSGLLGDTCKESRLILPQ